MTFLSQNVGLVHRQTKSYRKYYGIFSPFYPPAQVLAPWPRTSWFGLRTWSLWPPDTWSPDLWPPAFQLLHPSAFHVRANTPDCAGPTRRCNFLNFWAVQDLAIAATARHTTHLLPLKLMCHQESGFSKLITSPRFKVASCGRTMRGYSRSNIIATYLMALIGSTKLTRSSTTTMEWNMKVESPSHLAPELVGLLTEYEMLMRWNRV